MAREAGNEARQDCTVEEQEGRGRPAGDLCGATKALFSDICGVFL